MPILSNKAPRSVREDDRGLLCMWRVEALCRYLSTLGTALATIILKVERRKMYVALNYTSNIEGKFGLLGYSITQDIFHILLLTTSVCLA